MRSRFSEELPPAKRRVSLRTLLIYPFVILIVVAVILTGFLSLYNSGKAAEYMAWQLMDEIAARIEDRVLRFLDRAHLVNDINANAIESGQIDLNDMREQELHFWHQIKSFDYISYSYIGHADGGFIGARRLADGTLQTIATDTLTGGEIRFFNTDNRGLTTTISSHLPYYDHKTRPWYKAGIEASKPTWSPVFIDAGGEGLTITAVTPLRGSDNTIRGVLGSSFIFSHINQFLRTLKIGESGLTFIIERSGMLVATSTLDATYTSDKKRIASFESENPRISQTGKSISEQFGDLSKIDRKQRLFIHVQGERNFVQLSSLTDHRGIDWLIVVIIPENDFMSHVKAGNLHTILLSLLALGVTVAVGFTIARRITRPILELNIAARSLADGDWAQEIKIDRRDEVGELAGSFNHMVNNLKATTVSRDRLAEEIEERRQVEDALRLSEMHLRKAAVVARLGNWEFETGCDKVRASEGARIIYGLGDKEWSIPEIQKIPLPEYRGMLDKALNGLIKEGKPYSVEFKIRRPSDGQIIDIHSRAEYSPEKGVVFGVIQDITERKRAEEAFRETTGALQTLIQASPVAVIALDPDGNVKVWNPAAERLFGWRETEVLGHFLPYVSDDKREEHNALRERVLRGGAFTEVEVRRQKRDGSPVDISVSAAPMHDAHGNITGIMSVIIDITERKQAEAERRRLEERLQRAEKMEALGTLAGGVAHDLNNVLGIVVGYAELLLMNGLDGSSSAESDAMEILKGGQRAAAIVQDLLTLARRGVSSKQVLNLNDIVLECTNSPEFDKVFSYHPDIRIETDLEERLLNISGSAVHLGKSLMNLVSNAAEAMSQGGVITIKTRNRYLDKPVSGYDEVQEGDYVVLSVSDTGEGIPAGDLKRIFEPFYTKKVMGRSGTGLGLAVIWGTVKDHLGYINVESREGKGTTFTLYYPVTREEISAGQASLSAAEYTGNGESILIVDDVKEQRELAGTMLDKLNYKVESVSSGEEAVEYLKQNAVDLVVLDMIMDPGMDGLDTYTQILAIHPHQKAIIVSGFSETERVIRAEELGAGAYVKKPYVLEQLGLAVRKELDRTV